MREQPTPCPLLWGHKHSWIWALCVSVVCAGPCWGHSAHVSEHGSVCPVCSLVHRSMCGDHLCVGRCARTLPHPWLCPAECCQWLALVVHVCTCVYMSWPTASLCPRRVSALSPGGTRVPLASTPAVSCWAVLAGSLVLKCTAVPLWVCVCVRLCAVSLWLST